MYIRKKYHGNLVEIISRYVACHSLDVSFQFYCLGNGSSADICQFEEEYDETVTLLSVKIRKAVPFR